MAARVIQRILVRQRDPISLGVIRVRFLLHRSGVMVAYDAHSLHAYVCASGDIRDPVTRQEMQPHELARLQRVCGKSLPDMQTLRDSFSDEVVRRELLTYLVDEFLALPVTLAIDVLVNIHQIAHPDELDSLYSHFQRHGIVMQREESWGGVPGWTGDVSEHSAHTSSR